MKPWAPLLLALGCGGGGGATPASPDAAPAPGADALVTVEEEAGAGLSLDEFAARYCTLVAACCPDGAACREAVTARGRYKAAVAEGCLAALQAAGSSLCTTGYAAAAQPCQRVFATLVASKRLGEPCADSEECLLSPQGPVRCAGMMGMGRCQVLVRGKQGSAPCVATVGGPLRVPGGDDLGNGLQGFECHVADGLWCDDASKTCARIKESGAACTSFGECGPTLHCDDATGRCAPRRDEGAACDVDEQCPSTVCGEDMVCAPPLTVDPALMRSCR